MSRHYLVDGYNLLYALPNLPPGIWQEKRQALLRLLRDERPHGQNRLTVVFDSREGGGQRMMEGEIEVVFTAGETADDWIGKKVREPGNARILTVVTDDQGLRLLVRGTGAQWMDTATFLKPSSKDKPAPRGKAHSENDDEITDEFKKKWL